MKSFKATFTLFILFSIFTLSTNAQLKEYTNATNSDSWHDPDNWLPPGVPSSGNDVLIPVNSIVNIGQNGVSMATITVEDNAIVTKFGPGSMTISESGVFAPTAQLNLLEGLVRPFGAGLTINGQFNSIGPLSKGLGGTEVRITGSMNIQSPSEPFLLTDITLHILPSGILTIEEGMIDVEFNTALVFNEGLIQKTAGTGTFIIDVPFQNTGTINVDSGSMRFSRSSSFAGGVYNVNSNGFIETTGSTTIDGTLTGQLEGPYIINGPFGVNNGQESFLNFSGPAGVEWRGSSMTAAGGADSILVNSGLFTVTGIGPNPLQMTTGVTFRNDADMIFNNTVTSLNITQGSTLHNTNTGIITVNDDLTTGAFNSSIFLNEGLIQKVNGTGTTTIEGTFENNGGTLEVNNGTLSLTNSTLTNGVYNVGTNGIIELNTNSHNINGVLTGQLDNPFIINSNIDLTNNQENFLDFSGPAGVEWKAGNFVSPGAPDTVLVNKGLINVTGTSNANTQLANGATLRNEGEIIFKEDLSFFISQASLLDNTETGIITLEDGVSFSGSGPTGIINSGTIQKITGEGNANLGFKLDENTETGSVIADSGTIIIQNSDFINDGTIGGSGTIELPNGYIIDGAVAPGSSPGVLTYSGNYQSSNISLLEIEIDGLNQGSQYDLLDVMGTASLDGEIEVFLGFEPALDDEFEVINSQTISDCDLPATVTTTFNNTEYTFDVLCNPTNVTLKVSEVLSTDDFTQLTPQIKAYPNPTAGNLKIELHKNYPEVQVSISNILGQSISIERFVDTNTLDVPIQGSPGIYFITISDSKSVQQTLKVIKN